ncbi:MAG: tRNA (guanosine(46)-N7)-methyltransferase TrmB [Pseudomonadota bacterium]|nr:tRNA (guanosine(46)-N7)-methyltransferase TrmB [Pseudomonadota bacterium]
MTCAALSPERGEGGGPPFRFYGRRQAKQLSPRQLDLLATELPPLQVAPDDVAGLLAAHPGPAWLEIGFGGAEHLLTQAARHPDVLCIGCEPFMEGVVKAVTGIRAAGLGNVRLWPDDVRILLEDVSDGAFERIFVLFPDPWPKTRHHKRRIVSDDNLDRFARVLRPGGRLRVATDHKAYAQWIEKHLARRTDLAVPDGAAPKSGEPPADHVTTRYQEKLLAGHAPVWFDRVRV